MGGGVGVGEGGGAGNPRMVAESEVERTNSKAEGLPTLYVCAPTMIPAIMMKNMMSS